MKIGISADSTCDIPSDLIKKYDINISYLKINLGDDEFAEKEINHEKIYDFVAKTGILPKTSAISSYEYQEYFTELRKKYDAVIHFSLSSELSSTHNNAVLAAKEVPGVYVIDSRQLSSGSGILVLSCADKIAEGKSLTEILSECESETGRIQSSFIVAKLNYLYKGGRCSAIAMFGANLLKLKIRIQLVNGKMVPTKKYMGKLSDVLPKYVNDMIKENPPVYNRCFVTSSSPMEGLKENVVEIVKSLGFKEVIPTQAGATICSHCGPETLGILYLKQSN